MCNSEEGIVSIDNDIIYRLGDVIEVVLTDVNQETRSIVAKPIHGFEDTKTFQQETSVAEK